MNSQLIFFVENSHLRTLNALQTYTVGVKPCDSFPYELSTIICQEGVCVLMTYQNCILFFLKVYSAVR